MEARSARYRPAVRMARMQVVDRQGPVYTYAERDGRDEWTVARAALGSAGARWLPVRRPALYAGEVFQALARAEGLILGDVLIAADLPEGEVLVEHQSAPLDEILRDMLLYSTNSTAELVGMAASTARGGVPVDLKASAARMNAWTGLFVDDRPPAFEDHSGLGDDSRISAALMAKAMVKAGHDGALRELMKGFPIEDMPNAPVQAKTGTLNFVNALTGYVDAPDGTELAFAIFCADVERRDALPMSQRERPEGGRSYAGRARHLQRELIERWAILYGSGPGG
jgi:D-alanyl-D-alanine carboxypeptidase/D-alanyl-D-alanine-endopeptidase (penicillin-binding protein 4)